MNDDDLAVATGETDDGETAFVIAESRDAWVGSTQTVHVGDWQ